MGALSFTNRYVCLRALYRAELLKGARKNMITSNQKIASIARDLGNRLAIRFQNNAEAGGVNTVSYAQDSNGGQLIFLSAAGSLAEGSPVILIYLQQVPMVSTDIFGNPELAYTPSTSSISYELNGAGAPIPTQVDLDTVKWELFPFGVRYNLAPIANGTAVTQASAAASLAAPALSIDQLYWPTKGN
jgi:hypothetical protein